MANSRLTDSNGRALFETTDTFLATDFMSLDPLTGAGGTHAPAFASLTCAPTATMSWSGAAEPAAPGFAQGIIPVLAGNAVTLTVQSIALIAAAQGPTAATTLPSWVASLSDATIKADMTSAIVNGTVGYAGLRALFANVAAGPALTAARFNDLKTIAANLNNGVSTSAYLVSITNALVNGDPSNATWTGGAASSVALGNLATGSSATQMSRLVGKWFLGTDLPSSTVNMNGSQFTVTYQAATGSIYGPGGPDMNDINQGYLGDCYLLASLSEVARQSPATIASMIVDNGNNTYGVRFYVNGVAKYVTVDNRLANGGNIFDHGPNLWAQMVEKAYTQFQTTSLSTGNSINYGDSWSTIGNGGWPRYALEAITGAASLTDFVGSGASWTIRNYNAAQTQTSAVGGYSSSFVLSTLISDLQLGYDLVLCSWTNAQDAAGHTTLVASHAMSIYGYNDATGMFQIRNPWGGTNSASQSWDTTFEVSLSTLLTAGDTITVANVAPSPAPAAAAQLSIAVLSATKSEGDSGTTAFTFTVARTGDTATAVAATWTVSGTGANAAVGADFTGGALPSGTVSFAAGETSKTVTVNVAGDTGIEADETFAVTLSAPTGGATIATASATGTIQNDDSQISIAATSATRAEGNGGTTGFTFTVTRTGNTAGAASANWTVSGAGANAANADDFMGGLLPSGTVAFAAGETSKIVTVNVAGDLLSELDETFAVTLSAPTGGATLGTATATGTILNDDGGILSIVAASAAKAEGNSGATSFTFTVFRTGNTLGATSATWTAAGTGSNAATAADFSGGALPSGIVSFAAGETSKTVTVNVLGDTGLEADETFAVTLSAPSSGATIATAAATGTILNDDSQISIAAANAAKSEGNSGSSAFAFTVTRAGNTAGAASANWTTAGTGANAANAADFTGGVLPSGTVSFAAGETSKTVTVNVAGDTAIEQDETFAVTLSAPTGGTALGTASAIGTILNDDVGVLSIAALSAAKAEGNSGTTAFTFTVTRTGAIAAAATATWTVSGSGANAAAAGDFTGGTLPTGTVSFAAGETSKTVTVNVAGDTGIEADETFAVTLSAPTGATIGTASAAGTILNDDAQLSIATANATLAEGNSGATAFTFTVSRAGFLGAAASAQWSVAGTGASAANAADFAGGVLPSGTVNFGPGESVKTITVNIAGDTAIETNEAFAVTLSAPSGATIGTAAATGTILNDDTPVLSIAALGAAKAEGNSGTTPFTFAISRTANSSGATSVNWTVAGGSANAADFSGGVPPSGTATFAAGETRKTVTVNVAGDTTVEADETFTVALSAPTGGATIGTASATGTILNDDTAAPPSSGLKINLVWNADALAAPAAFRTAVQTAANLLQAAFSNNITLNFHVGYGEVGGQPLTNGSAAAGPSGGIWMTPSSLKSTLLASASSTDDTTAYNGMSTTLNPNGNGNIAVWSAQRKALGLTTANSASIDGEVGFATDISTNLLVGVALHEITHAMGRTSGYSPYGIADVFRYSAPGTHVFAGGGAAYLSADNGATRIADFAPTSDFGDFNNSSSLTANDSFNAFYTSATLQTLTRVDLRTMDLLGYRLASPLASGPALFAAAPEDVPAAAVAADTAPMLAGSILVGARALNAGVNHGLDAPALTFLAPPPVATRPAGPATLDFALYSGAEILDNFHYGLDQLRVDLGGLSAGALDARDTTIDGVPAVTLFSTANPSLGVVFRGMGGGDTAASLLNNHLAYRDGYATVA